MKQRETLVGASGRQSADAPTIGTLASVVLFALSAVPFWIGLHIAMPSLIDRGVSPTLVFLPTVMLPLLSLGMAAFAMGAYERGHSAWPGWRARLRLRRLTSADVRWTAAGVAVILAGYFGLGATSAWLESHFFAPPSVFSSLVTETEFLGFPRAGNWWVVGLHAGVVAINVLCEELWFRGMIFPRQEARWGHRAWLIHGLSYHAFHMFYPWDAIRLLPESLAYGFVAQRTKNTWSCVVMHSALNGIGVVLSGLAT